MHVPIKEKTIDYISCDQVIHHTSNPPFAFDKLSNLLKSKGEFCCYVYRKKALPRVFVTSIGTPQAKQQDIIKMNSLLG